MVDKNTFLNFCIQCVEEEHGELTTLETKVVDTGMDSFGITIFQVIARLMWFDEKTKQIAMSLVDMLFENQIGFQFQINTKMQSRNFVYTILTGQC